MCCFASTFSSDPTATQHFAYVRLGRLHLGENKAPGDGLSIKPSVYHHSPGFVWSFSTLDTAKYRIIFIPLWAPTLLAGAIAAWCWRRERQRRRLANAGSCPACGYSRAGLAADAKCPECGVQ